MKIKLLKILSVLTSLFLLVLAIVTITRMKSYIPKNAFIFSFSKINFGRFIFAYIIIETIFLIILVSITYTLESPYLINEYSEGMNNFIKWYLILSNTTSIILCMVLFLTKTEFNLLTSFIAFIAIFSNVFDKLLKQLKTTITHKK